MKKNPLLSIFFIVLIEITSFGLILPLLPFYAETFNANALVQGLLIAAYSAAQVISTPILGRLSDRYGRRPLLLLSVLGTAIALIMLGLADALWILFAARLLDGFTGGNISVAQAYITDVTDEKNRAKGLGLIGAAFGLGFIVGPALGAFLSQWGFGVPALVAAALELFNLVNVYFNLPESLTAEARAKIASQPNRGFTVSALVNTLKLPFVGSLLALSALILLPLTTFQTVFSIYTNTQLGLDAQATGFLLTYVGVLAVIVQVGLIGRLTQRFSDRVLLIAGAALLAVGFLAWGLTSSVWFLLITLLPVALGSGLYTVILRSALSKSVHPDEVGGILGITASLESATRVVGPILGAALISGLGAWSPGVFGAVLAALALIGLIVMFTNRPKPAVDIALPASHPAGD